MIDHKRFGAIVQGSALTQNEVVAGFRTSISADAKDLRAACAEVDYARMEMLAHRIKGACMMVGAARLAEGCSLLAMAGRARDPVQASGAIEFFNREFVALDAYMRALPAPDPVPSKSAATADALPCASLRFLVADDHAFQRSLITRLLVRLGAADVAQAEDGISALEVLAAPACRVDIAVLDLSMPGLDGLDVVAKLAELGSNVSLILNSALSPSQLHTVIRKTAGSPLRILGVVTKPLTEANLRVLLQAHQVGTARPG